MMFIQQHYFKQSLHQIMTGFEHGFGAEASLSLAQNAPAVSHDTTRLCQNVVAQ